MIASVDICMDICMICGPLSDTVTKRIASLHDLAVCWHLNGIDMQ